MQTTLPSDAEVDSWPWHDADGHALIICDAYWERHPYVWVLDIEHEHRAEAEPWLDANVPGWRNGRVNESGRAGLHVFFRAAKPVETDHDFPWGDVQGRNALVILPPSISHKSGKQYRTVSEGEPVSLEPGRLPGYKADKTPVGELIRTTIPEHYRNDTLFRYGSRLRGDGFAPDTVEVILQALNRDQCLPPLDRDEVTAIARSTARYEPNPTVTIGSNGSQPPPPTIEVPVGGGGSLVEFTGAELVTRAANSPNLEYLPFLGLDGYIVKSWSHLIAGYPRVGKTELIVRLVRLWIRRGYRVLYITEESAWMWSSRLVGLEADWDDLNVLIGLGVEPIRLYERAFGGDEDVVIVDTFRNLLGLHDEKDNSEIARAVNPWVAKARETEKTLIFGHHDRKGGGKHGEAIAGGHALLASFDIALEVLHDQQVDRRRIVKGYPRLITIPELVYEMDDAGELKALGNPAALRFEDVKERVLETVTDEWETTKDVHESLDEPKPGREQVRKALVELANESAIERDPPISESGIGKTHKWRVSQPQPPTGGIHSGR